MSALDFALGDLFTARVVKYHAANPDRKWANSYEFQAREAGNDTTLLTLLNALVEFEAMLHRGYVLFDRAIISTWAPDSVPYNPEVFISSTRSEVGGGTGSGDALGLGQALTVTRSAVTGRFGHLFYRGALSEGDIVAPAGKTVLADRASWNLAIDTALDDSGLGPYVGIAGDGALSMVMVNKTGTQIRPVVALLASGVTNLPIDHAWYNRSSG